MEPRLFRKLNVELPIEKATNERPWMVAGIISALAFIVVTVYAYLKFKAII